jgi:hypothetical protein
MNDYFIIIKLCAGEMTYDRRGFSSMSPEFSDWFDWAFVILSTYLQVNHAESHGQGCKILGTLNKFPGFREILYGEFQISCLLPPDSGILQPGFWKNQGMY